MLVSHCECSDKTHITWATHQSAHRWLHAEANTGNARAKAQVNSNVHINEWERSFASEHAIDDNSNIILSSRRLGANPRLNIHMSQIIFDEALRAFFRAAAASRRSVSLLRGSAAEPSVFEFPGCHYELDLEVFHVLDINLTNLYQMAGRCIIFQPHGPQQELNSTYFRFTNTEHV